MKEKKAVYPGSFDPPTNGHLDIIERGLTLFDKIIVAVIVNPSKKPLFTVQERRDMLNEIYRSNPKVEVDKFNGLLVKYVAKKNANTILRGLRAVSDFEYEFQMALMNRKLDPNIKSVYLMPSPDFTFLSSSMVKEVCGLGGDIGGLVPEEVEKRLKRKLF